MKLRCKQVLALVLAAGTIYAATASYGKDKSNDSGRLLTGKVTGKQDQVLVNAVVYLSNTRTRAVKSFIVGQDGIYRFPALSPNIDYEVYAQHEGHKSDTKTVSQFDTRPSVNINLRIDK
jgi:Carboxypeptidase regulatory-like domain